MKKFQEFILYVDIQIIVGSMRSAPCFAAFCKYSLSIIAELALCLVGVPAFCDYI